MKRKKILRSQARGIVFNVYKFLKHECVFGVQNVKAIQQRTASAAGTSVRTLQKIIQESLNPEFKTPGKKRSSRKRITEIDSFAKGFIKRQIHRFHVTYKQLPTIGLILNNVRSEINFKGNRSSFRRVINSLGFSWKKTNTKKKVLLEHTETRLKRIEYLDKIREYRAEGRPVIYTDESYSTKYRAAQSIVIMHAGSDKGILKNCLVLFKAGLRTGEYPGELNYANYEKWIRKQLIPNLEPESVVVIGNTPRHNKLSEPIPSPYAPKAEMTEWLQKNGVQFDEDALKPQLHKLITQHKNPTKTFAIDEILSEHNHTVLRVPPYHPDLNPIKIVIEAAIVHAAEKNPEKDISKATGFVKGYIEGKTFTEWTEIYEKVLEAENEYLLSDPAIDLLTENYMDRVVEGADSSSSDDEMSEESNSEMESSSGEDSEGTPSTSNRNEMSWDELVSCI